jgi:hypothetical protein
MNCIQVTSLEEAMKKLPSSVVPIEGLRRDNNGNLTRDALRTIVDGLKSRGIDPTDPTVHDKIQADLATFLCSLNNQYSFLMKELVRKLSEKEKPAKEFIEIIKDKNITMQDVINVSRHLDGILPASTFIEGWQNTESVTTNKVVTEGFSQQLNQDLLFVIQMLSGNKQAVNVDKRMVEVSEEKNKIAYNYLGLYGFLNLIAIGLLIFIAAGPTKRA